MTAHSIDEHLTKERIARIEALIQDVASEVSYPFLPDGSVTEYVQKIVQRAEIIEWWTTDFVGMLAYYGNDPSRNLAYLTMLCVRRKAQGSGVGRAMLEAALSTLRRRGFKRFGLRVHSLNVGASRLYRDSGFQVVSQTDGFLDMELTLSQRDAI